MSPPAQASAVPARQRSRAGRTLMAIWVLVLVLLAAGAVWLQVLGPPASAPAIRAARPAAPISAAAPTAPAADARQAAQPAVRPDVALPDPGSQARVPDKSAGPAAPQHGAPKSGE